MSLDSYEANGIGDEDEDDDEDDEEDTDDESEEAVSGDPEHLSAKYVKLL